MPYFIVQLFAGGRSLGYWGFAGQSGPVARTAAARVTRRKADEVANYYNLNPRNSWSATVESWGD